MAAMVLEKHLEMLLAVVEVAVLILTMMLMVVAALILSIKIYLVIFYDSFFDYKEI
jgi:hypothetical protein